MKMNLSLSLPLIPVVESEESFAEFSEEQQLFLGGLDLSLHLLRVDVLIDKAVKKSIPAYLVPVSHIDVHVRAEEFGSNPESVATLEATIMQLIAAGEGILWSGSAADFLETREDASKEEELMNETAELEEALSAVATMAGDEGESVVVADHKAKEIFGHLVSREGVFSVTATSGSFSYTVRVSSQNGTAAVAGSELFFPTLALALVNGGSVILSEETGEEHAQLEVPLRNVSAWRVEGGLTEPLSAGEVFSLCNTDADGQPIPPEPGCSYVPGFVLDLS